jgi:hypothetical protein
MLLLRSRDWQRATTRQLSEIDRKLGAIMNAHEAITLAVNNAVTAMQAAVDQLAQHATANDDDELNALASRLQNSVSALSTAATRHGVDVPPTGTVGPGADTISGAGSQPTVTTSDTVQGASSLTQGGAPSFPDGTAAQGQTGTVASTGGNDTIAGGDPSLTSHRR